jgi:hypothetical protein
MYTMDGKDASLAMPCGSGLGRPLPQGKPTGIRSPVGWYRTDEPLVAWMHRKMCWSGF